MYPGEQIVYFKLAQDDNKKRFCGPLRHTAVATQNKLQYYIKPDGVPNRRGIFRRNTFTDDMVDILM